MQTSFDSTAPKKPTNVSINSALLLEARALKINLSATLEQALIKTLRESRKQQWLTENKKGLEECNKLAEENGLFSDKHRLF